MSGVLLREHMANGFSSDARSMSTPSEAKRFASSVTKSKMQWQYVSNVWVAADNDGGVWSIEVINGDYGIQQQLEDNQNAS